MSIVNLNDAFPTALDGTRGPLPKQREFLNQIFDIKNTSKYIAYVGGIGSGKTLIGCVAMLSLAVLYPGDYLVARQYMPELKITTLKTFLEICPKELLAEYRVADGIVKIRSQGGKLSNIIFRQLDEVDKLRSLNLNAFYIDEASQASEAALLLLQGRLRGAHVRKGFITSNPNGHDYIYQWWVKQDHFKNTTSKKQFYLIKAPSTENTHLPDGYVQSMMETWSDDRIQREIMGSFDAFEGQVYHEFRRDVHVVPPFKIPDEWTKVMGMDHGYRNPAAALWGAVDYDGNVFIYKEFYQREWLIEEICKGNSKLSLPGLIQMTGKDRIEGAYIDPSTRARRGTTGHSDWDSYREHLPADFPLLLAQNDKTPGIDKVKSYFKLNPKTNKPRLFIFSTCANLIEEIAQYRYAEIPQNRQGLVAEKEEPVKVNDHACDALRYLIMSRPDIPVNTLNPYDKFAYDSMEGVQYRWLQGIRNPKPSDPLEGI